MLGCVAPSRSFCGWTIRLQVLAALVGLALSAPLVGESTAEKGMLETLSWRSMGPVNMSGRVTDVEGLPGDPSTLYVGAASGGVWKTVNGGLSFSPIFDDQPIASIGDIALAPSNPNVIYVGTGEANPRNSVSIGGGVYVSTDAGRAWRFLGLEETRHISRVVVHPQDPQTVWVAALGHVFGPNEDRGVFKTTDGGATWRKVLYLDPHHGVADMDLDPNNPNVLFAGLWHFERKPWTHETGSTGGGIYKSVDGGETWAKVDKGLPKLVGRLGVRVAPSNSNVVYVIAESDEGTLFRSDDHGESFVQVSEDKQIVSRGLYYTKITIDPADENRVYAVSSRLFLSIDGGKHFERISRTTHVDYHALWADPEDPKRVWQGQDGGVAVSYDRGGSWEPIRNLPIGQFYQVFYDEREPFYYLGGGLQDNGTWYGPSRTREPAGILEDDWRMMSFGDAYFVVPHPEQVDLFLSEYQAGGLMRTDMTTRQQVDVSPQPRRNDGGPAGELTYRFNWNAPIIASPHDPETVYFAGNVVFKTRDFGDTWTQISPDLTTNDASKLGPAGGPAWVENTTAEYHCTIISFAESPVAPGVLWAGTDDGRLHVSQDAGETWKDVSTSVPIASHSPVSHVEPSRVAAGVAYASFDRHMFDDYAPHLFRTDDFGVTWTSVSEGLPKTGWIWVVREDPRNSELLWVGTEMGLFASYDAGTTWQSMRLSNFPAVSVHDVLIHPRENDLIVGTHGRAIWIFDDATALQHRPEALLGEAQGYLYPPRPALLYPTRFTRYGLGDKEFRGDNPPSGAVITYALAEDLAMPSEGGLDVASEQAPEQALDELRDQEGATNLGPAIDERLKIEIVDGEGQVLRALEGLPTSRGVHRVQWDLASEPPRARKPGKQEIRDFSDGPKGAMVLPSSYTVRLTLDDRVWEQVLEVKLDPALSTSVEGLRAAREAAQELVGMESLINDSLRTLDSIELELEARGAWVELVEVELGETVERSMTEFRSEIEDFSRRLARPSDQPFWSLGPALVENLGSLRGAIDSQFQRPTAAQVAFLNELREETSQQVEALNGFLWERVPSLNTLLQEAGMAPLSAPQAVGAEEVH